jgi:tRNA (guanine37-N1)-methyltransferase
VPQVLLNGDHGKIAQWRAETALERTRQKRPDLLQPDVQKESR